MPATLFEANKKDLVRYYKELLSVSYRSFSEKDKSNIREAFDMAIDAHKNQYRKSGEPYIFHPIKVALIVADQIGLDSTSIAAALLHDVVEDSSYTLDHIKASLGEEVAKTVDGLTKISHLPRDADVSHQAENFRKMLLTLNDDLRVIIIKIADRLHNMQTLDSMPKNKQLKIASETLYIYAPLAHRIGLYNIKTELEDLGLKYTDYESYSNVKSKIDETKTDQDKYIEAFSKTVKETLGKKGIVCTVKGRSKSIYSIHKKMQAQQIPFERVFDKFAVRVIYQAERDEEKAVAWQIYSLITDVFTPNPTRLRDWITAPKSMGYEALHVTVMGPSSKWVEVQIRSERMHEIAERGYAAHYKYKQADKGFSGLDEWLDKIKEALDFRDGNSVDFIEQFRLNLYAKEISVFTPKGEVRILPKGATVLDFAFNIHTEVGLRTRGALVNEKMVALSQELQSGDQVEIITAHYVKPSLNWLAFSKTSRARSKIKTSLREEKRQLASTGKEILYRKLRRLRIQLNERVTAAAIRYFKAQTAIDLYYDVQQHTIDNKALREFAASYRTKLLNFFKKRASEEQKTQKNIVELTTDRYDSLVFGENKQTLKYALATCCVPLPGDEVFGFVGVNGKYIKVHKINCPNTIALQSKYSYRIIAATWVDSRAQQFDAVLNLSGIDNKGVINELTRVISQVLHVNIISLNISSKDSHFIGRIKVSVKNIQVLKRLIDSISKIKSINKVTRE